MGTGVSMYNVDMYLGTRFYVSNYDDRSWPLSSDFKPRIQAPPLTD